MRRSSCLFLLTVAAVAQQMATVTGKVTNSVNGAPVVRAHVTLQGLKNFGAVTDGEGKFSITGIVPGGYAYAAERVGFTSEVHMGTPFADLKAGETSLDLTLIPAGSIAGRVLGADGEPAQLVNVHVEGPEEEGATTDNKGQYRIGGLGPGKYRVKVFFEPRNAPPEIRTDGSTQVRYISTYYPGVPASKGATRVTVAAGGEVSGIDIPLLSTPIVKVSGKVLDIPAGTKKVSVYVGYDPSPGSSAGFTVPVGKDGSFVVWGLDPGAYTLRAETGDGRDFVLSAPIELPLGTTDIDHVELRLAPPFAISGHIEYEDEQAREASKIAPEGSLGLIKAHSVYLSDELLSGTFQGEIGDDDTFKLEKVQPGRYFAGVTLGHTYVKSVSLGSVESANGSLDVRNGPGGDSLTLMVSAAWGEISGTASDSNGPVAGARIAVMQDGVSRTLSSDTNGHYSVPDLRPGIYRLVAGDEKVEGLWRDDSELEDYENAIVTVELHAGDKITQDLKQVRPDK